MTIFAVFSDIHANLPALLAASHDARQIVKQENLGKVIFISLGDVVDYGPNPSSCLRWVNRYVHYKVRGNHDEYIAAADFTLPLTLAAKYRPITVWTRTQLSQARRQQMRMWPLTMIPAELPQFTLMHGSPESTTARIDKESIADAFSQLSTPFGLFGHTHHQGYFVGDGKQWLACEQNTLESNLRNPQFVSVNQWRPIPAGRKVLFNPGSIGQPRRNLRVQMSQRMGTGPDVRAAYLLLDPSHHRFQFRRVAYDVQKTVTALKQLKWDASQVDLSETAPLPDLQFVLENNETLLPQLIKQTLIPTLTGLSH